MIRTAVLVGLSILVGAAVGALLPLVPDDGWVGGPSRRLPSIPPPPRSEPCAELADELPARLSAIESELEVAEQEFARDWGEPMRPPDGWDAAAAEEALLERLTPAGAPLMRVDCSVYPCVGLVAVLEGDAVDPGEIARDLDLLDGTRLDEGFVTSAQGRLDYVAFAVGAEGDQPDDEAERRWCERLTDRLVDHEHEALVRVLYEAAPDERVPAEARSPVAR